MKKKSFDLAVVIHSLKIGGSERFTLNLLNRWAAMDKQVMLILLEKENPLLTSLDKRVSVRILNRTFKYDFFLSFRIQYVLNRYSIDKVFCVEPYAFFLTRVASVFQSDKRKYFISLHHSEPTAFRKHWMDIFFLNWFRKQDEAIFICAYQQTCFARKYHFKPPKSSIIYNGINTSFFDPVKANNELPDGKLFWRKNAGITDYEPVMVMIGRISPEKGHQYAIEALSLLHTLFTIKAHLVIVGDGDVSLRCDLERKICELQLEAYVHFEGAQNEVRPYLLTSDLFTLTSISETFSLAALEALSMGLPVVMTNVGGAAELIKHEQLGELCTSMDPHSIASSWASILKRRICRSRIRNWIIDHHQESNMVASYVERLGLHQQHCGNESA